MEILLVSVIENAGNLSHRLEIYRKNQSNSLD